MKTPEQVKEEFKRNGITYEAWAEANDCKARNVTLVLNGYLKGNRGESHEIAKKLGLK